MKNIIAAISAGLLLFGATSCSQEDVMNPSQGDGSVNITVTLPGDMGTRAFADGKTARDLDIAVYDASGKFISQPDPVTFAEGSLTATVSLNLARGVAYKIAFFAHDKASGGYAFDAENNTVTANYSAMGEKYNTDVFDCFFALYETEKVTGPVKANVTLKRPVAQINWGTADLKAAAVTAGDAYGKNEDGEAARLHTRISMSAYATFDMLTGDVTGSATNVTFPYLARPSKDESFPVKPETYKYVSMQYVLVPKDAETVDMTFEAANSASATAPLKSLTLSNVPVQANYRTNIFGKLLTSATDINVNKDPNFGDNINVPADAVEYTPDTDLSQGGDIKISATLTDGITIPAGLTQPLNLYVNAAVPTITMPMSNNAKAIKIVVAKDVAYPEVKFPRGAEIDGFSLVGDPASTELAKGFIFMVGSSSIADCPKTLRNFTLDGVKFDGVGFIPKYSVTTENVVIRNCSFLNCKDNAIGVQHVGGGAGQTATNYTIENCKVTFAADVPANTNGLYLLDIQGTLIVKNTTIENAPYHGITISGNPYNGNVARASKIEITGNTITGSGSKDGIKIDGEIEAELIVTGNHVKVSENGIRIKNSLDSNNLTITGNTVDCEYAKEFSNGEPWGILIINKTVAPSAVITGTEADNAFINSKGHNFSIEGVTASETN